LKGLFVFVCFVCLFVLFVCLFCLFVFLFFVCFFFLGSLSPWCHSIDLIFNYRYNVPHPDKIDDFEKWAKEVKRPIQVRTAYILKALIALRWKEFDRNLKRLVKIIIRLLDKNLSGVIKTQIMREVRLIFLCFEMCI